MTRRACKIIQKMFPIIPDTLMNSTDHSKVTTVKRDFYAVWKPFRMFSYVINCFFA